ncbi:hypothetical protein BOTBODRAFT_503033 [Botryobasidium botryosum FD-172 SS1]|uniref:Uncharacterized protein n=1 Tax=Botryobasidium botryosum (strain FD-172 SS1) TaxID=930990 RepID=A0A067M2I6_BOTB1|nr:hypothetical protein BOTBODRAFT_503033 [Botryobasidium botryosum FD-172 SS1]
MTQALMLLVWRSQNGQYWLRVSSRVSCEPAVIIGYDKSASLPSIRLWRHRWCCTHTRFPSLLSCR